MPRFCFTPFSTSLQKSRGWLKCSAKALSTEPLRKTLADLNLNGKMDAWQIHSYGDLGELQFTENARVPQITSPNELLIKVHAASVNPLDIAMIKGYGRSVFSLFRTRNAIEFPLTLGRDFSGIVVNKGCCVGSRFSMGDPVWGVVMPARQGSHAEYVIVDKDSVTACPPNLTFIEAASIPYAGLTAYSGLMIIGEMMLSGMKDKRVLVLGAAGGVGSMAVQILKAGGATVICTCSSDAKTLVTSLGVDMVLDRNSDDFPLKVVEMGPYDIILDCAGQGPDYASKYKWKYKYFVTFTSPFLRNFDNAGLIGGALKNAQEFVCSAVTAVRDGSSTRWAFVLPYTKGIEHLQKLVEQNQLKPVVNKTFNFKQLPEAYKAMMDGHLRGKIIIDMSKD